MNMDNKKGSDTTFGSFIREKRLQKGKNLRTLAKEIGIAPAYMCDIENDHRYPPEIDKLEKIAVLLSFTEEEKNEMFDFAGNARKYTVSPDLSQYVMENQNVRVALRLARDNDMGEEEWKKVIKILEEEKK